MHTANAATVRKLACEPVDMALLDKLEFIALKEKGSTNEVSIYFSGAIPTKSEVRSTTDTKWLDFGGGRIR